MVPPSVLRAVMPGGAHSLEGGHEARDVRARLSAPESAIARAPLFAHRARISVRRRRSAHERRRDAADPLVDPIRGFGPVPDEQIAVRAALGASRARVIGMILFDVVKFVTPGVFVGMILTAALIRLNGENMGIPLSDVENLAYIAGAAIAVAVAVVASFAPARRAASVPPMVAIRSE